MIQAGGKQRMVVVLTALVGVTATAVAYLGTRQDQQPAAPPSASAPAGAAFTSEVIVMPHDEPEWPPGPHQRTFLANCTICHSTRLVMTQPSFPRAKWQEIVHKMVKTYGAPITHESEQQIVEYLVTVRGQ